MISLEGLTVSFGRTLALHALTLDIKAGITGLFGPNGSGKSTLLRVLAGLLRPTAGRVTIDGRPGGPFDESTRRLIGYAGHDAGMYERLTVKENLELFAKLYGTPGQRVDEVLEHLQLGAQSSTLVGVLSAGLQRRAAVARALLHEPRVLLLDEPYANLDEDSSMALSEAIKSWRAPDRVALIATHGAKKVKAYADAGIILRNGRLVVAGEYRLPPSRTGEPTPKRHWEAER